jgi:N-acylneuraminate cytidylyltransferase
MPKIFNNPRVLVVIPARGGSKGIPYKNIQMVGGYPLVARSVMAAKASPLVTDVFVSTDDDRIASLAQEYGAGTIDRPSEISGDTASSESAILHAEAMREEAGFPSDIIVLLQCTAPFTTTEDITGTIAPIIEGRADSSFAAVKFHHFIWNMDELGNARGVNHSGGPRIRRQDIQDQFLEAGSVYAMRTETLKLEGHRFCGHTMPHEVPPSHVFEIDTPEELRNAQFIAPEFDKNMHIFSLPKPVQAVVFDFDGVFTDNKVLVDETGTEAVCCNRSDGMGINLLQEMHIPMIVLSKEQNTVVSTRCRKLNLPVMQGINNKLEALKKWLKEVNVDRRHTVYIGNEINDMECMEYVGCAIGPLDSHPSLAGVLKIRLSSRGGGGVIREVADLIVNDYQKIS